MQLAPLSFRSLGVITLLTVVIHMPMKAAADGYSSDDYRERYSLGNSDATRDILDIESTLEHNEDRRTLDSFLGSDIAEKWREFDVSDLDEDVADGRVSRYVEAYTNELASHTSFLLSDVHACEPA